MEHALHADVSRRVVIDTASMDWQPSPSPTVLRKRLELAGGAETGRVTSIVRYAPGSAFPAHEHPEGEEILVLEGVFSDEHGAFRAGTYLLNPPGFAHAPFSREGCVLFVKLRQYGGAGRRRIVVDTGSATWQRSAAPGVERLCLYRDPAFPETASLVRLHPGAAMSWHEHPRGAEIFVLSGALEDDDGAYPAGTWLRLPPGSGHAPRCHGPCAMYVKQSHLG